MERILNIRQRIFFFTLYLISFCATAFTISWDPSNDPSVLGYKVYYGTSSGNYTTTIDAGKATSVQITDPPNGVTYYAVVTAYAMAGIESLPSQEVSYTAPFRNPVDPKNLRVTSIIQRPEVTATTVELWYEIKLAVDQVLTANQNPQLFLNTGSYHVQISDFNSGEFIEEIKFPVSTSPQAPSYAKQVALRPKLNGGQPVYVNLYARSPGNPGFYSASSEFIPVDIPYRLAPKTIQSDLKLHPITVTMVQHDGKWKLRFTSTPIYNDGTIISARLMQSPTMETGSWAPVPGVPEIDYEQLSDPQFPLYIDMPTGPEKMFYQFHLELGDNCTNDPNSCYAVCGDNILSGSELCDDGNLTDGDGCNSFCENETNTCGDSNLDAEEECDDGNATDGDGCDLSCHIETAVVPGCTDVNATNYNENATEDDGSCTYEAVAGCTDANAANFNPAATIDDGSCIAKVPGCTDANANNFDPNANTNDGSCTYTVYGCIDPDADNFNSNANTDDGSCTYPEVLGCTDSTANNFNSEANVDDGSCDYSCVQKSSFIYQNSVGNPTAEIYGANYISTSVLDLNPSIYNLAGWRLVTAKDMNRDGTEDLVWQKDATGEIVVWFMSCGVPTGSVSLATVGAAGRLVDVADLNRDGHNDLIFQNRTNGQPSYSYLNGFTTVSSGYIGAYNAGLSAWTLVAVKDFNGDGRPDLVWQNNSSTTVSLWIMNGVTLVSGVNIPNTTNLVGWKLIAVPDLNKDGRPDLLWQHANYVTGAPNTKAYWHLNSNLNYTSSGYINSSFNTNRKLIGTLEIK